MLSTKKLNHIKIVLVLIAITVLGISVVLPNSSSAFSGSDFKAGRISDDAIFFSAPTLSIAEIQNFLNSKVPTCDTWGAQPHGSTTRAAYAASNGVSTPFTCLKDFRQNTTSKSAETGLCNGYNGANNQSAAEIIYRVGESCGVNSKVIIVLLQKEQSLITDDWPWPIQYRSATGYGCPDTAPCDAEYYGFFNQVYSAARQFKRYSRDKSSFNYRAFANNNVLYNPNASCGSSNVYIENQATAGLYNYTPYQPNQAALNNLYGTGDSCSSYGNRNFWRMFYDWFGNPINDAYAWEIIKEPGVTKNYLVVNHTRYYIPGPSINSAWGFDQVPYREVTNAYFNGLSAGADLNYVGYDTNGTRYMMNAGKKIRLATDQIVLAWGLAGVPHIFAPGVLAQATSAGDAARFATSDNGITTYLLDGNTKRLGISGTSLNKWGYNGQSTNVATSILDRLPTGAPVDRYINVGSSKYIIDNGDAYVFGSAALANAWGDRSYVSMANYALNLLPRIKASTFVKASNDTKWYYLEGGKKHYVPSSSHANIWGWGTNNPLVVISSDMLNQFTASDNVGYLAKSSDTGKYYLINGTKHWINNAAALSEWTGSNTIPTYTEESLSLLSSGVDASSTVIGFVGSPHIYGLNNGKLAHVPNSNVLDAMGANNNNPLFKGSSSLNNIVPKEGALDVVIRKSNGSSYYIENGTYYLINPAYANSWRVATSPTVSDSFFNKFNAGSSQLNLAVSTAGKKYLMNGRQLLDVTSDYENYGLAPGDFVNITRQYFNIVKSSHLVGTAGNNKIWLLAYGMRYHIPTYGMLLDLGYGSHSGIVSLDSDITSILPESASIAHRVLKASTTGSIFASSGKGLGFKDSATLSSYLGGRSPLIIPASVFNKFSFSGWTTRIIYGTNGKIYLVDGGSKRWITSPTVLWQNYGSTPWTQLSQPSIDAFPNGSNIN